jgi:hypothetical protein
MATPRDDVENALRRKSFEEKALKKHIFPNIFAKRSFKKHSASLLGRS